MDISQVSANVPGKAWPVGRPWYGAVLCSSATSARRHAFCVFSSVHRLCSSCETPLHWAKGEVANAAGA